MAHPINLSEVLKTGLLVGGAALIASPVTAPTAFVAGATFALIEQVTKPFFGDQGILSWIANAFITSCIVNSMGYTLSTKGIIYVIMVMLGIAATEELASSRQNQYA